MLSQLRHWIFVAVFGRNQRPAHRASSLSPSRMSDSVVALSPAERTAGLVNSQGPMAIIRNASFAD